MRTHRNITQKEIDVLLSNGTECSNWDLVQVKDGFNPQYIKNTIFSGKIKLGVFEKDFTLSGGLKKHSGIYNAVIHNCTIGDNVLIENIQNILQIIQLARIVSYRM